ncbi:MULTISPECIES: hypothetical protein [Methylobacterium]|jgi:hypothetical protein|uniref:Uncharacterized protein n=2 Tax=Methylobacterium bullatum TaxID=570505 RepID=A0A679JAQ9_9HYPH|nr:MULTISPECIES: hypothetical protein [Methylobacterium]KQO54547.1 hypothetical protein ASF08_00225 [Methylobacterium sp. Leaf85]KQP41676.1 hypothetical protein ASF34_07905 [Methylobacterium sp. Leaf106]MBD8903236.1 hypothetical protein [Methylobacterium bullatum]TXN27717.1 hypothetical protein FV220_10390 [Methylobacterium sp. WL19]CAA2136600.1 hypothetical protein MBLL_00246 [Methylobacterium bullatum]
MAHSIYVRKIGEGCESSWKTLAHAIQTRSEAVMLARRLASSYPESGADPFKRVFWFRDRTGLHEIRASPES